MRKLFSGSNKNPNTGNEMLPHKALMNAILLVDDIICRSINKVSEKIETKTGHSKKTQAIGIIGSTTAVTLAVDFKVEPVGKFFENLCDKSVFFAVYSIRWGQNKNGKLDAHPQIMSFYDTIWNMILALRLIEVARGAISIASVILGKSPEPDKEMNDGIYRLGFGIALYLLSTSNGTLERLKNWLGNISAYFAKPQPILVNSDSVLSVKN